MGHIAHGPYLPKRLAGHLKDGLRQGIEGFPRSGQQAVFGKHPGSNGIDPALGSQPVVLPYTQPGKEVRISGFLITGVPIRSGVLQSRKLRG